ncbi:MAG: toll/interleukin-1 receptor domain-containing protein [Gammaproteobacteria bacterium]|nr:toll/interleukin-1 receptor domain-containing protein [Gammaproteobacteria bacterium]
MLKVFISYSHRDELWKDKLLPHLKTLEQAGMGMVVWHDRQIDAGEKWHPAIQEPSTDFAPLARCITSPAASSLAPGCVSWKGNADGAWKGNADGAKADLDETWQIAERGAMKLRMADIHLHRARLFRDRAALEAAARLIEEPGYHRRLRDAREAAQH